VFASIFLGKGQELKISRGPINVLWQLWQAKLTQKAEKINRKETSFSAHGKQA
jgi:hypothetical protein